MNLTWEQLREYIESMPQDRQKDNVSVFDHNEGEYYGVRRVEESDGDDVLDDGASFLVTDL